MSEVIEKARRMKRDLLDEVEDAAVSDHSPPAAGLSTWWGKITVCNITTGVGKAKPVTGGTTYAAIVAGTATVKDDERDVIIGWMAGLLTVGKFACFVPSGNVTTRWTAIHHVPWPHTEPIGDDLAEDQDDGGGVDTGLCA